MVSSLSLSPAKQQKNKGGRGEQGGGGDEGGVSDKQVDRERLRERVREREREGAGIERGVQQVILLANFFPPIFFSVDANHSWCASSKARQAGSPSARYCSVLYIVLFGQNIEG